MTKKGNNDAQYRWRVTQEAPQETVPATDIDNKSMEEQRRLRYKQDTAWRSKFSVWVMIIVPVWLLMVYAVVILQGFDILDIPTSALNVLLATTTANILGLAHIVLKGIFPQSFKKQIQTKK